MNRSKWKGPYIKKNISKSLNTRLTRSSTILPIFINKSIDIHNGKNYVTLKITENMVGYKLGEFIPTRKVFSFKKKKTHGSKNKF